MWWQAWTTPEMVHKRAEPEPLIIIACGERKSASAGPVALVYEGKLFHQASRAAARLVGERPGSLLMVLSAKHGLLLLDAWIEPYDMRPENGLDVKTTLAQQLRHYRDRPIVALLTNSYDVLLAQALGHEDFENPLRGSRGFLEQSKRYAHITRDGWQALVVYRNTLSPDYQRNHRHRPWAIYR